MSCYKIMYIYHILKISIIHGLIYQKKVCLFNYCLHLLGIKEYVVAWVKKKVIALASLQQSSPNQLLSGWNHLLFELRVICGFPTYSNEIKKNSLFP